MSKKSGEQGERTCALHKNEDTWIRESELDQRVGPWSRIAKERENYEEQKTE